MQSQELKRAVGALFAVEAALAALAVHQLIAQHGGVARGGESTCEWGWSSKEEYEASAD
jgi:hypothetical protein